MSYIGREPQIGNFQVCDAISTVNNQAAYTMQVGGVNVSPETANHMLVSLNGILQAPTTSYTVSGSTITFASNLVTGDVINFIQILGNVLDLGVPSDSTVSIAKLTATGTKDATTFLRGDNTFNAPPLGGITMADQWRLTSNYSMSGDGDLTANLEQVDTTGQGTLGSAMTQSSGVFTFPSTGIWYVAMLLYTFDGADYSYVYSEIDVTTNNSSYTEVAQSVANGVTGTSQREASSVVSTLIDVTNTTNVKVKFGLSAATTGVNVFGNTDRNGTSMMFIRLGDT